MALNEYKIGVLAGGDSSEREISLKSGRAVFNALIKDDIDAVFIDVHERSFYEQVKASGIDAAFIVLHGRFGEDGSVQTMLDEMRIPYTGSGPEASKVAMDKVASKEKFISSGIKVPGYKLIRSIEEISPAGIEYPCVVKPKCEGSSVGLYIVEAEKDLLSAVKNALRFGQDVIIEDFIPGREVTVGVVQEEALPVIEIRSSGGVYDFDAKYKSKDTEYLVPAVLGRHLYNVVQEEGVKAHKAVGCRGFSRVDMKVTDRGDVFILEVNTIPGMTERSLLPMAARESGLDFSKLCIKMLSMALKNRPD